MTVNSYSTRHDTSIAVSPQSPILRWVRVGSYGPVQGIACASRGRVRLPGETTLEGGSTTLPPSGRSGIWFRTASSWARHKSHGWAHRGALPARRLTMCPMPAHHFRDTIVCVGMAREASSEGSVEGRSAAAADRRAGSGTHDAGPPCRSMVWPQVLRCGASIRVAARGPWRSPVCGFRRRACRKYDECAI